MRGFLARASAALGRAIVSLGYGPVSGEAPPVDTSRGCMTIDLAATGTMTIDASATGTMTIEPLATGTMTIEFEAC